MGRVDLRFQRRRQSHHGPKDWSIQYRNEEAKVELRQYLSVNHERFDSERLLKEEFAKMHHPTHIFGPQQLIAKSSHWGDFLKQVPANSEFKPYVDQRAEEARFRHEYANAWRGFRQDDWRWQAWLDSSYLTSPDYLRTLPSQDEDWKIREAALRYYLWEKDSVDAELPQDTLFAQLRQQWRIHPFGPARDSLWYNVAFEKHASTFSEDIQAEYVFWKSLWHRDFVQAKLAMDMIRKEYKVYTLERELVLAMFGVALQVKDLETCEALIKLVGRILDENEDPEWDIADLHWMNSLLPSS